MSRDTSKKGNKKGNKKKKGRWIGIELPTSTGFMNVLIGLDVEGGNVVEYCNEADIRNLGSMCGENPWCNQGATMKVVKESGAVFGTDHRLLKKKINK